MNTILVFFMSFLLSGWVLTTTVQGQCTGGEYHDDGTPENAYGWNYVAGNPSGFAQQFVPTVDPVKYGKVCIGLTRVGGGVENWTFNITMWSSVEGMPGDVLASTTVTASGIPVWPTVNFFDFTLPDTWPEVTGLSPVFIGIMYDPTAMNGVYVAADESVETPLWPSFGINVLEGMSTTQTWFPECKALLIRAEAAAGCTVPTVGGTVSGGSEPLPLPELLYYKFDESTSATSTANLANPGVGANPAPFTNVSIAAGGQFNNALSGAGISNAGVSTGWNWSMGSSSWTISMFVNIPHSEDGSAYYLFGDGNANGFRCFHNGIADPDNLMFRGGGFSDILITGVGPDPTAVAIVYDANAGVIRIYKNGVLDGTYPQPAISTPMGGGFKVGSYYVYSSMVGLLDEFRVFNRALSDAEILNTWNQELGAASGSLVYGNSTTEMTLTGQTGSVLRWQKRLDGGSWIDIENTATTYSEMPTSVGTWEYRAVVKNGSCQEEFSTAAVMLVTPKELTVTGAVAQDKVYDGNALAQILGSTLVGVVGDDDVFLNHTNGYFAQTWVGTDIPVETMPMILAGADAANYTLVQPTGLMADITPKEVTVTVTPGQTKVYGSADPAFAFTVSPELLEGDTFTGELSREPGENVGLYAISEGSLSLGSNYTFTFAGANFEITVKPITVTAVSTTKIYDTTIASDGIPTISPALIAGDTPEFIQVYDTEIVGTGKTLIPSGLVDDGNGGLNYQITFVNATNGAITPATLVGMVLVEDKPYDGTVDAVILVRSLSGVMGDDYVVYSGGTATFPNPDVEENKTVTVTGLHLTGADAGNYTVNTTATDQASITRISATSSVATDLAIVQYSDEVTLTATILGGAPTGTLKAAQSVTFTIGGQVMTDAYGDHEISLIKSGTDLVALLTVPLTETTLGALSPGSKTVTAIFNDSNDNFSILPNPAVGALTIAKEDARINYTGDLMVSATGGMATVVLKATVNDITVEDDGDDFAGDIRNATVTFVNRRTNAIIGVAPVTLLNAADPKTGSAQFSWTGVREGDYVIGMVVGNYYTRDFTADNTVVLVHDGSGAFMSGAGNILPTLSSGQYASDARQLTNFGFDVKFDDKGVVSHGHSTILIRKTIGGEQKLLEVNSSDITKVSVNIDNAAALTGGFIGTAALSDITNPVAPVVLSSGLTLNLTYTDRGTSGTTDGIGITLLNGTTLYYSSNWEASETSETTIAGGDIMVRSTFNIDGGLNTGIGDNPADISAASGVIAYPNPSSGMISFRFNLEASSNTTLDILSVNGTLVSRVFEGFVSASQDKTITYDSKLPQGIYFYKLQTSGSVRYGKIVITKTL